MESRGLWCALRQQGLEMIGYNSRMRIIEAASLGAGFKYCGNFGTADSIDQYVYVRDRDSGLPVFGIADLVADVRNPDGTLLSGSPFPLSAIPGITGLYKFRILPGQRSQIGYYTWRITSATASIDQPIVGGFVVGFVVSGAGNRAVTISVKDVDTEGPIPDAQVYVRDSTGTTIEAGSATNGNGEVVFNLWDGTYRVYISKLGNYQFTVPETLVVSGDVTETYRGHSLTPAPPPDPEMCMIYGWLYEIGGTPWVEQTFRVSLYSPPPNLVNIVIGTGAWTVLTDATGYFSFNAFRGSQIRLDIPQASIEETIVLVPDQASIKLKVLLGLG